MSDLIYLDAAASTALAPEVFEAMAPVLTGAPGNPSSAHWAGDSSRAALDLGRQNVADLMDVGPASVVFTSGATEANNLAIRGLLSHDPARTELVTCTTEHASVLQTMLAMRAMGYVVHVIPVDTRGLIELDDLRRVLSDRTALVSIHAANNETGVMQDMASISDVVHETGSLLHSDASQLMAWGESSIANDCDLVTVSSHKMHGPQGVGALVASRAVRRELDPLLSGGGQEHGLRSGTANVAGIVGFGAAASLSAESGKDAALAVARLRDTLAVSLHDHISSLRENTPESIPRLPGVLNVALAEDSEELDAQAVLAQMPRLAASTGSACRTGAPEPSPVLLAMGLSTQRAMASVRLSLSRYNTIEDVDAAVTMIADAVQRVRQASRWPGTLNLEEVQSV